MKKVLSILLFFAVTASFAAERDQGMVLNSVSLEIPLLEPEAQERQDLEGQHKGRKFSESAENDCPVCHEPEMGSAIPHNGCVKLQCGHKLCGQCYDAILMGKIINSDESNIYALSCPQCRANSAVSVEIIEGLTRAIDVQEDSDNNDLAQRRTVCSTLDSCCRFSIVAVCTVLTLLVVSGSFR